METFWRIVGIGIPAIAFAVFGMTSRLKVEVNILDRTYLRNNPAVLQEMAIRGGSLIRANMGSRHYDQLADQLMLPVKTYIKSKGNLFQKNADSTFEGVIRQRVDEVREMHQLALQKIDSVDLLSSDCNCDSLLSIRPISSFTANVGKSSKSSENSIRRRNSSARSALSGDAIKQLKEALALINSGYNRLDRLAGDIAKFVEATSPSPNYQSASYQRLIVSLRTETSNFSKNFKRLYDDPLASIVAHAPEDKWDNINHTKARTHFGNADIAIVMESSGDYTIKGMRNDASQATKTALTMLNQTITAVASTYGVGLPGGSTADTAQTYSRQIIDAEVELEQYRRTSRTAQIAILEAILSQQALLSDTTAVKSIQNVFNSQKKQLIK